MLRINAFKSVFLSIIASFFVLNLLIISNPAEANIIITSQNTSAQEQSVPARKQAKESVTVQCSRNAVKVSSSKGASAETLDNIDFRAYSGNLESGNCSKTCGGITSSTNCESTQRCVTRCDGPTSPCVECVYQGDQPRVCG